MPKSQNTSFKFLTIGDSVFLAGACAVFCYLSLKNYLLFHSLVEMTITIIGLLTAAFTWHLRRFELGYLLSIGLTFGCTAFMGIFHLLSFRGMGVIPSDGNLPTQLWIASRYLLGTVLLLASMFPETRIEPRKLFTFLITVTAALMVLVFTGNFPDCFHPETKLTDFKIISEYVISGMLVIAMILFWRKRENYPRHVTMLIMSFFSATVCAELVFTSYLSLYGASNMLGHLFHFVATYFIYKAIVKTGLETPFDLLFTNLKDAVLARDEFISLASHELKTPLTPLKLQLQMFQREMQKSGLHDERVEKMARNSNKQLDRLNQLIDGMLDVSRLSTGRFEIYREKTDLAQLINELTKKHEQQLEEAQLRLKLTLTPAEILVDPLRIEQVITNLLLNAAKYAPGSSVEIGVEMGAEKKVRIWVSDTGPGIPQEFRSRIFNRYERGTPSGAASGLGLGLYISRQIVETHGGTLELDARSTGTRFNIVL